MEAIKNCPHCNRRPLVDMNFAQKLSFAHDRNVREFILIDRCKTLKTVSGATINDASKAWNAVVAENQPIPRSFWGKVKYKWFNGK